MTNDDKKQIEELREYVDCCPESGGIRDMQFLLAKLDEMQKIHGVVTCAEMEAGVNLLQSKLDEAHEALRFYANRDGWNGINGLAAWNHSTAPICDDCGEIARKALGEV